MARVWFGLNLVGPFAFAQNHKRAYHINYTEPICGGLELSILATNVGEPRGRGERWKPPVTGEGRHWCGAWAKSGRKIALGPEAPKAKARG